MCVLQSKVLEHRGCCSQFDLVTLRRASGVTSVIKRKQTHTHTRQPPQQTATTTTTKLRNKWDKSEAGIRICEEGELRRDLQS